MSATVAARNAANAQHSTGPVTPEGKARSAQNALRHGLTSRAVVLPHESREEYESLRASLTEHYAPVTDLERDLLTTMLDCRWRLNRALRIESEFFLQKAEAITEANPDLSGDAALAAMFEDSAQSRSLRLVLRYITNAQNAYRRAKAELEEVIDARLDAEEAEQQASVDKVFAALANAKQSRPEPLPERIPTSDELLAELRSGFVSQSSIGGPETLAPAA